MSTTIERPTPETDAELSLPAAIPRIRRLERERDEAREKLKATRRELTAANKRAERCSHINNSLAVSLHEVRENLRNAEAELSVAVAERDDFRRKLEAMRSAIKDAAGALSYSARMLSIKEHDVEFVTGALVKLQHFIKP